METNDIEEKAFDISFPEIDLNDKKCQTDLLTSNISSLENNLKCLNKRVQTMSLQSRYSHLKDNNEMVCIIKYQNV